MSTYVSNRDGGKTNEEGHYRFQTNVWQGNVIGSAAGTELKVKQNSPLGMSVLVSPGDLKIDYSNYAYTAWNDADTAVTIATADGSNPRIDRIIAYIDRGATPQTVNPNNPGLLVFTSVAGTAAAVPSKASDSTVNSTVGASNPWCEIATVRVNASVTTVSNSSITDTRTLITVPDNSVSTTAYQDGSVTGGKMNLGIQTAAYSTTLVNATDITGATVTVTPGAASGYFVIGGAGSANASGGSSTDSGAYINLYVGGVDKGIVAGGRARNTDRFSFPTSFMTVVANTSTSATVIKLYCGSAFINAPIATGTLTAYWVAG